MSFRSSGLALLLVLAGCAGPSRQPPIQIFGDMRRQPKYKAQMSSAFFADGRASRAPVPGTVAWGRREEDTGRTTGIVNGMYVGRNPLPLDRATLTRGQERFNIYCAPCHDQTGSGHGIVAIRSSWLPANLHDARQMDMTDGEIFAVITNGRRTMPAYRFQVPENDRWAIVAYVRALQRTTQATVADVPEELRGDLR